MNVAEEGAAEDTEDNKIKSSRQGAFYFCAKIGYMPPEETKEEPVQPPSIASESESVLPKIRTFKTDASIFIKENKVSDLGKATQNYVSQQNKTASAPQINYKKIFIIAGGTAILAVVGFVSYGFINGGGLQKPGPVVPAPKVAATFVQTESESDITFTQSDKGSLTNNIKTELGKQLKFDTAKNLKIKSGSGYISSRTFISSLGWAPPADFIDNLEPDFNLLIVYQDSGTAPVFIFKSKDFTKSFAALLDWEPVMWEDMKPFLDLSSIDVATFYRHPFSDDSIKNNDARAFLSLDGRLLFEYTFFNKKFIIISTSRDALALVLGRFMILPQ